MNKKIQLSIPTPCHESWESMTPVDKARPDDPVGRGKFCGSCQKQVIDFSNMNDRQVADFFKKPILSLSKGGSVCGRFMTDQLEREIDIPRKRIPWVKYFFQFALPAFLLSLKSSVAKAQGEVKIKTTALDKVNINGNVDGIRFGMVSRKNKPKPLMGDTVNAPAKIIKEQVDKIKIMGKVIDENGNPVPYATIIIKGTKIGIPADSVGEFTIIPNTSWEKITLTCSSIGFETTEINVDRSNYSGALVILTSFKLSEVIAGEVIITRCFAKKAVKPIPLIPELTSETKTRIFKAFPNPIPSGASLTIECKQTEEGYYTFQLLNQSGQSVYNQEIWIDGEARVLSMAVPFLASGNYYLIITNKKTGRKISEKIIIQ